MKLIKIGLTALIAGSFLALVGCADEQPAPVAAPVAATVKTAPVKAKHKTYHTKLGKVSTKHDKKK